VRRCEPALQGAEATSLLVVLLVDAGIGHSIAYLASIPPVTIGLFFANRFWTFSDHG